jgi:hypothetical protein
MTTVYFSISFAATFLHKLVVRVNGVQPVIGELQPTVRFEDNHAIAAKAVLNLP